jgi:3'-phosphoadenosine 5'-phosphosulfate sulfotransferase (PAPS reductase)/FAD synthetase
MNKKRFISFSGGVESTTMCILYGRGATAIWCDTGAEHKEMYERMDKVEARLKQIHGGDFELKRIKPSVNTRLQPVTNIIHAAIYWKYLPSKRDRWCTKYFKILPIDNFLREQGQCELLIGFNADEQPGRDRTGNFMACENVDYRYPLHEEGYTREMCEDILHDYDLHPDFPIYMSRGGCWMCMFKEVDEYKAMYFFDRSQFEKGRKLEKRIQHRRKKFFSISMSLRSMDDIAMECEREIAQWGEEECLKMYAKVKQTQSCGAFCHR